MSILFQDCSGYLRAFVFLSMGFSGSSDGKESACNAGDFGSMQILLYFHANFKIIYSNSAKTAIGILIKNALNLQTALSSIFILIILFLLLQEQTQMTQTDGIFSHVFAIFFFLQCHNSPSTKDIYLLRQDCPYVFCSF